MLFGRGASPKEEIDAGELEGYLNKCFDEKLGRLAARVSVIESGLKASFSSFRDNVRKFASSNAEPNMEYFYRVKESFLEGQKPNYSTSMLRIVSVEPKYEGENIYYKGQSMLSFYNEFRTEVLKANNTFKLVLVAYAGQLSDVKKSFDAMEKLCKELNNEIESNSQQFNDYRELNGRIKRMLEYRSNITTLRDSLKYGSEVASPQESAENEITQQVQTIKMQLETARKQHNDTNYSLSALLLPIERIARKHDHTSQSKRKLTDYIENPIERIKTHDDAMEIGRHISEMMEEVGSGKLDAKDKDGILLQLKTIKEMDIFGRAELLRERAADVKSIERELAKQQIILQGLEKERKEKRKMLEEKGATENEIEKTIVAVSSDKGGIEKLFLNYYKKMVIIKNIVPPQ